MIYIHAFASFVPLVSIEFECHQNSNGCLCCRLSNENKLNKYSLKMKLSEITNVSNLLAQLSFHILSWHRTILEPMKFSDCTMVELHAHSKA